VGEHIARDYEKEVEETRIGDKGTLPTTKKGKGRFNEAEQEEGIEGQ